MRFFEAYEKGKALGRNIKQNIPGATFVDPDSFTSLGRTQAMADDWVVEDEKGVTITASQLKTAWDAAIRNGGFTSVKTADSSPLFKEIVRVLFAR